MENNDITVYTTKTWPHCTTLKRFLSEKGITYKEVDLSVNEAAQEEVVKATGMLAVPQTNVNGKWVVGFDPDQIMQFIR